MRVRSSQAGVRAGIGVPVAPNAVTVSAVTSRAAPAASCAPGDPQQLGQSRLRQADVRPQCQHLLTEGIVSLTVGGSLHGRSPFRVTLQSKAMCSNRK